MKVCSKLPLISFAPFSIDFLISLHCVNVCLCDLQKNFKKKKKKKMKKRKRKEEEEGEEEEERKKEKRRKNL